MINFAALLFACLVTFSFCGVTFASTPTVMGTNGYLQHPFPLETDEDKEKGKKEEGSMKEDKGDDKEEGEDKQ